MPSKAKEAPSYRKGTKKPAPPNPLFRAYVIGEKSYRPLTYNTSHVTKFLNKRRRNPTTAEKRLEEILRGLNNGILIGRFQREYAFSGKWIADFWIPEVRLAIEVDGSIHNTKKQKCRDKLKDSDAARFDITLIRITNDQVFGDRQELVQLLREGWLKAHKRKNRLIGQAADPELVPTINPTKKTIIKSTIDYVHCNKCADKIHFDSSLPGKPSRLCEACGGKKRFSKNRSNYYS